MNLQAILFDLDGVIVSTDEYHYQAWHALAETEGIPFGREDNERLRGVSRMESLDIILEKSRRNYSASEKEALATRKNEHYRASLSGLSAADILPGVPEMLQWMKSRGIRTAIGSSSKNAMPILQAVGLAEAFEVIVDGTHIRNSKPDPEVFLLAAERLGVPPEACLVVEDAESGVLAGKAAGMKVLGVGSASVCTLADLRAAGLNVLVFDGLPGL